MINIWALAIDDRDNIIGGVPFKSTIFDLLELRRLVVDFGLNSKKYQSTYFKRFEESMWPYLIFNRH
jgi:hypothetical protein